MDNTLLSPQASSHSVSSSWKRWVILGGILGLGALGACGSSDPLLKEEEKESLEAQGILYEAGPMQATEELSLENTEVLNLNELRNLPEDGNVLKVHTACMDSSTGISYAAGIMSSDIAVIEGGKTTKYFPTGLEGGTLKYLYCDKGYLLIVDESTLMSLDPETGKELAQIESRSAFVPSMGFLDEEEGFFILPEPKSKKITMYDAVTLKPLHSISTGEYRTNWFKDENGNLLALQEDREGRKIHALWYNPETFAEIKTADLDIPFSESMDYDPQTDSIWVALGDQLLQFSISGGGASTTLTVPEDIKDVLVVGDRVLVVSENGYDDNEEAGYKGGLLIVDASTGKMEQELVLPWKHAEVDANGNEAIVTNNDGNSVSLVNLETGDYEVLALGSAAESLAVNDEGTLYIANRLGGSTIVTADSGELDSPGWPVGLAYSPSLDQIFAYNMLGSSVDVIDANSNELLKTYDLGVEDANSDALASSTFDETHHVLFAAIPELFTVVALDVESGDILKTIVLPHERGAEVDGGLGGLLVGVYEPTMMVYVYSALSGELLRYDGLNDFALLGSETVSVEGLATYRLSLFVDQYHGRVFLGSSVFDAETGELIGTLPEGPQSVLGIDNERGVLFAVGLKGEEEILYALHADLSSIVDQAPLPGGNSVRATGIYDAKAGKIYVSQMTLGEVWIFDVLAENLE